MTINLHDLPHAVNTYLETSTRISTKLALLRRRRSPVRRAGVRRRALPRRAAVATLIRPAPRRG